MSTFGESSCVARDHDVFYPIDKPQTPDVAGGVPCRDGDSPPGDRRAYYVYYKVGVEFRCTHW